MANFDASQWKQSDDAIEVSIKLKGAAPSSVATECTDAYIRVNHKPHITIIDFNQLVKFDDAVANIHDGTLTVTIPKQQPGVWQQLFAEGSRAELNARRQAADERKATFMETKRKQVADAKRARGDAAFKSQMQLEEARRQRLDDEKRVVKEAAQQDVYDTLLPLAAAEQRRGAAGGAPDEDDVQYIPGPRASGGGQKIEIAHSERPFPTPLRESRHKEESDWLSKHKEQIAAKERKAREGRGLGASALPARDLSERDPAWLKSRGDAFAHAKDFMGAINAYSAALLQQGDMVAVLSNRALCHLQRGHALAALDDCCLALALVAAPWHGEPQVAALSQEVWAHVIETRTEVHIVGAVAAKSPPGDSAQPVPAAPQAATGTNGCGDDASMATFTRLMARRAAAFCQQGMFLEAQRDLLCATKACRLRGGHDARADELAEDAEYMLELHRAQQLCSSAKQCAADDAEGAVQQLTEALQLSDGGMPQALLNRAACLAQLARFPEAVDDCTAALSAVMASDGSDMFVPVPPALSDAGQKLKLQVLTRRGLLLAHLGLWSDALPDLRSALSLDPADEQLRKDMQLAAHKVAVVEHTMPAPGAQQ